MILQTLCGKETINLRYDSVTYNAVMYLTVHVLNCDNCKVLGETAYRERYSVQEATDPSDSQQRTALARLDTEGEALPPGGYARRPSEVSANAASSKSSAFDSTHYVGDNCPGGHYDDKMARAHDERAERCSCLYVGTIQGKRWYFKWGCPIHG